MTSTCLFILYYQQFSIWVYCVRAQEHAIGTHICRNAHCANKLYIYDSCAFWSICVSVTDRPQTSRAISLQTSHVRPCPIGPTRTNPRKSEAYEPRSFGHLACFGPRMRENTNTTHPKKTPATNLQAAGCSLATKCFTHLAINILKWWVYVSVDRIH